MTRDTIKYKHAQGAMMGKTMFRDCMYEQQMEMSSQIMTRMATGCVNGNVPAQGLRSPYHLERRRCRQTLDQTGVSAAHASGSNEWLPKKLAMHREAEILQITGNSSQQRVNT